MADCEAIKSERQMIDRVSEQLVKMGVPSKRIVKEKWILRDGRQCYSADIVMLNEDGEGVHAVFECKFGKDNDRRFIDEAWRNMHFVMGLCKCYLVKVENGDLVVARLLPDGLETKWQKLSNLKLVPENSEREVRDNERKQIVAIGLILVAIFVSGEWLGLEFSWKIYSLLMLVAVLFAAASGYRFSFKAGLDGCALSVGGDVKKEGTSE